MQKYITRRQTTHTKRTHTHKTKQKTTKEKRQRQRKQTNKKYITQRRFKKERNTYKMLQDLCLDFDLVDIWCIRNPDSITWRQRNPLIQRRLYYWLISDVCQDDIEKSDIIPSINSDHSANFLHFNSTETKQTRPFFLEV